MWQTMSHSLKWSEWGKCVSCRRGPLGPRTRRDRHIFNALSRQEAADSTQRTKAFPSYATSMTQRLRLTHERRWVTVMVMMCARWWSARSESLETTAHSQTDSDLRSGSGNCVAMPACLRDSSFKKKTKNKGRLRHNLSGLFWGEQNNEAVMTVPRGLSHGWLHVPSHRRARLSIQIFWHSRADRIYLRQHSFTGIPLDEQGWQVNTGFRREAWNSMGIFS